MNNHEQVIAGIEVKVRLLADEIERLRALLIEKENRCMALHNELEHKNIEINRLNEQNRLLTQGSRPTRTQEQEELREKIDRMVETIDKSLQILHTQL